MGSRGPLASKYCGCLLCTAARSVGAGTVGGEHGGCLPMDPLLPPSLTSLMPPPCLHCSDSVQASSDLFGTLRNTHLMDGPVNQKRADALRSGLREGLVDSSCVQWAYCKAKWSREEPAWAHLRWQLLTLVEAQQQPEVQQQAGGRGGRRRARQQK